MDNRRRNLLLIGGAVCGASLLIFLPALLSSPKMTESFWIDWVWLDQFARELGGGNLYPRWLPLSHHGLGSPVFYYYPPAAFYLGSAYSLAGLSTYASIVATFMTASVFSGIGMYLWLKGWTRSPAAGSMLFVIAPYHVLDFYARGALAEATAIAVLPFLMLNLRRIIQREGGIVGTAIAYACLIGSHLPLALLASLFLVGPYLAWHISKEPVRFISAVVALGLGIVLACIYLVPALTLEPFRDASALWSRPMFQPSNWTFWNPVFLTGTYLVVLGISTALAIPCVRLMVTTRSRWATYSLLCILIAIGSVPFIWDAPLLRSVQFPFRILPLAEFGLATAFSQIAWSPRKLIETVAPVLIATGFAVFMRTPPDAVSISQLRSVYPDVPENLPPGNRAYSWPSIWALQTAKDHPRPEFSHGVTTEPIFFFPAWDVRCGDVFVPTFPARDTGLLSYRGQHCVRSLGYTNAEKIGARISVFGLLGLLAILAASCLTPFSGRYRLRRRKRRTVDRVQASSSSGMLPPRK